MIKVLLNEVREYKLPSILAPLFMALEVILEIMLPFLMGFIIDEGVNKGNMDKVLFYGAIMGVVAGVSLLFGWLSGKFAALASAGFAKNVRKKMFHIIQDFSFENVNKYSTSGLVTRLMTDVTNVQNAYQMVLRLCVRAPLILVCAMFMTFYINPSLASVFLYAIIFLGIVLTTVMLKVHPIFLKTFAKYDDLNASVQENVTNMRVVKAYVREDGEITKFEKASYNLYKMFKKAESIIVFNTPAMQFAMYGCILAISWIGAQMIVSNSLMTGELMSMFTYTMNILMSLMMISMIFVMLSMSFASVERIGEILKEKPSLVNPKNPVYEITNNSIEFQDVSFGYAKDEDNYNLSNLNIKIQPGEMIGIIGGTGSAKTTLVQIIPRLYDVSEGSLLVGGRDVREYDIKTLRNMVAMVLQKNVLFSGTIKENLKWGNANASDEEMQRACEISQADEFIQRFPDGYDTYIEQGGSNVSGGQKQRLCIARALLKNPSILILDDSTSAVDTKTDAMIRSALKTDLKDTTKLIISQRISSLEEADRIIVLDDGRIHGIGTHEELLKTNTIYQDVYATQVIGGMNDGEE